MTRRAFTQTDGLPPMKAEDNHGTMNFVSSNPDLSELGIKSVNINLDLGQVLQLQLALDRGLLSRTYTKGKSTGLGLSIKAESREISVIEADSNHGTMSFVSSNLDLSVLGGKSVNIDLDLSQVLQLRLALGAGLFSINRYNRTSTNGKSMGLCLSIKTESRDISVIERSIRKDASK